MRDVRLRVSGLKSHGFRFTWLASALPVDVGLSSRWNLSRKLSTVVRHGFSPIVIVFDNQGYGTERLLHPGEHRFNDIHPWNYHKLPQVLGGGTGYEVRTEAEFATALKAALADKSGMSLLNVHLSRDDCSPALQRLAKRLAAKV